MIDRDKPYLEAELLQITLGNTDFVLIMPFPGTIPLRINAKSIDPKNTKLVPQNDSAGNREGHVLCQDWYYFNQKNDNIEGYLTLDLRIYSPVNSSNLVNAENLKSSISERYRSHAGSSLKRAIENALWEGLPKPTKSSFVYPKPDDFTSIKFSGLNFQYAELGDSQQDSLYLAYFCSIDAEHYASFKFCASGFTNWPNNDFTSKQAFLQSLTHDFMRRIQITSDHPVSA